jgi:hypothetical protein
MEYKSNILENLQPDYIQLNSNVYADELTGNVSIGEVQSATFTNKFMVKATAGDGLNQIALQHSGNGVAIAGIGQESSHGSLQLRLNSGATQVRLSAVNSNYIIPSLGVGGVTSPNAKLHIAGGSSGMFLSNLGNNSAYDSIKMSYTGYNSGTPEFIFTQTTTPGSGIANTWYRFKNTNGVDGTNPNNVANVTIGGRLGIGTDNPSGKINVIGSHNGVGIRLSGDGLAGAYYYGFMHDGTNLQGTTQTNLIYTEGTVLANTTISEWASLRIANPNATATGAVITNNYAIKQDSSSQKNFFAGKIGVNANSPIFKVQTNADITGSWLGYLNGTTSTFGANNFSAVHSSTAIGTGTESGINLANNASDDGAPSPIISFSAKSASGSFHHAYAAIYGIKTATGADTNWNKGDLVFATGQSTGPSERVRINNVGAIKFNAYDSTNNTGTPTYILGTDASGNVVKTQQVPGVSGATSLYDLIPNGAFTTTYAFTSTAGTYSEVMSGDDVITLPGTYTVQMYVSDYSVGGTQYREYYSGVMSWNWPDSTNDTGIGAVSEIVLHRAGHAANQGIIYLRTKETGSAGNNELKLEIMCNKTYTGASNVVFKFVRLI